MEIKLNGDKKDISMVLVSAERYALGKQTYIVAWTCEVIKNNLNLLTDRDRSVMIRDIENATDYGDKYDEKDWKELLRILKGK